MCIITTIMYISRLIMPLQMQAVWSALFSAKHPQGTVQGVPPGHGRFIHTNQGSAASHRHFIDNPGHLY